MWISRLSQIHVLVAEVASLEDGVYDNTSKGPLLSTLTERCGTLLGNMPTCSSSYCFMPRGGVGYRVLFLCGTKIVFGSILFHFRTTNKRKRIKAQVRDCWEIDFSQKFLKFTIVFLPFSTPLRYIMSAIVGQDSQLTSKFNPKVEM